MLANALQAMNDPEAARATLRSLESSYPDNPNFLFLRGVVLHALGESSDAVACLRRVMELNPDHERAGKLLQQWG